MDLGVERLSELPCGSAEVDKQAPGGDAVDDQSVLREPLGDPLRVSCRRPESRAKFLRRQPPVKVGGVRVVLAADEPLQLLLLRVRALQHQQNMIQGQSVGHPALVELRPCPLAGVAGEPGKSTAHYLFCCRLCPCGSPAKQSREHCCLSNSHAFRKFNGTPAGTLALWL